MVWLPLRQLTYWTQHDVDMNNYWSAYFSKEINTTVNDGNARISDHFVHFSPTLPCVHRTLIRNFMLVTDELLFFSYSCVAFLFNIISERTWYKLLSQLKNVRTKFHTNCALNGSKSIGFQNLVKIECYRAYIIYGKHFPDNFSFWDGHYVIQMYVLLSVREKKTWFHNHNRLGSSDENINLLRVPLEIKVWIKMIRIQDFVGWFPTMSFIYNYFVLSASRCYVRESSFVLKYCEVKRYTPWLIFTIPELDRPYPWIPLDPPLYFLMRFKVQIREIF